MTARNPRNKKALIYQGFTCSGLRRIFGVPKGIRTPVLTVKG